MDIQQAHAYAARELRKVESDLARALERKAPERDIADLQKKVDYRTFVAKLLEAMPQPENCPQIYALASGGYRENSV